MTRSMELERGERHFRMLADSLAQLVWLAAPDGGIFWCNRRWYDYTGLTSEQMRGNGWQAVHDPGELPKVLACRQSGMAARESFDMVFPLKDKNGVFRPFLTRVVPIKDDEGQVERWFGTNTDITEVKRAAELRQQMIALVESADDAILTKNLHGIVRSWNPAAERMLGYRAEDIVGESVTRLIPEDRLDEASMILDRITRGQRVAHLETIRRRKNGSLVQVSLTVSPIRDEAGTVVGASKIMRDISQRKQAEAELRKSHERIAIAAQAAGQGFWDFDIEANTLQWDDQMFRLYGRSKAEGEQPYALWVESLHPDDRIRSEQELRDAIAGTRPFDTDFRIIQPNGLTRHIRSLARVTRNPQGRALQMFGLNYDVTERKQMEAANARALQRLNEAQRIGQIGDWEFDVDTGSVTWSAQVFEIFGRDPQIGPPRTAAEHAQMYDAASRLIIDERFARAINSGEPQEYELIALRANGEPFHLQVRAVPRRNDCGRVTLLHGTIQDISERKRLEQRLRLMVNELNHRVKNTLAVVQAIAAQTLMEADPLLYESFEDRLSSLALAHGVLTRENWTGADLYEVVAGQISPYGGARAGRCHLRGPELRLSSRAILALAPVLHELATNAVKYGALSNDVGEVHICWDIAQGAQPKLRLTWTERLGPKVDPSAKRGFGSQLIEHNLAGDLAGVVRFGFDDPEGVTCVIETPLALVAAPAGAWPRSPNGGEPLLEVSK